MCRLFSEQANKCNSGETEEVICSQKQKLKFNYEFWPKCLRTLSSMVAMMTEFLFQQFDKCWLICVSPLFPGEGLVTDLNQQNF